MHSQSANDLQNLRASGTRLVVDTAKFKEIEKFNASEGTTNPSLILAAAQSPEYASLLSQSKTYLSTLQGENRLVRAVEHLSVSFGVEIFRLTGCVSTEVDVRLSFDTGKTIEAALRIIELYAAHGVPKEDVRIKIAATWEGVQAARVLEREHGISVLITVMFGMAQALLAAEAGVTAIAPYVGRIGDWHKERGRNEDFGVVIVRRMQDVFRQCGYRTQIMAASFRSTEQCRRLAGVDMLTVAPKILEQLQAEHSGTTPIFKNGSLACEGIELPDVSTEGAFRWAFNSDACAVEKSTEAIRRFAEDTEKLERLIAAP